MIRHGNRINILALEPYYGGSHRTFLDALAARTDAAWRLLTLPARKWKWRMRLGAQYFAARMQAISPPDLVFCSDFVDVAALRGAGPAWLRQVPCVTYYHENQFAYPNTVSDPRDLHFGLTNLTTALASDRIAFNSRYNLESFLEGCRQCLRLAYDADMDIPSWEESLRAKAVVLFPGLDFTDIDRASLPAPEAGPPVVLWNHRWEHDKGPENFFSALNELRKKGTGFRLIVCGQSFQRRPAVFDRARRAFAGESIHFGFAPCRREYVQFLRRADIVVSTAAHEFFGMAVLEAVRAGCRPLLPARLSYPELFPSEFLYREGALAAELSTALTRPRLSAATARQLTAPYTWDSLLPRYASFLCP